MAATLLGATVVYGGQATVAGYIVERWQTGGAEIDSEDVQDAAGARVSRIVFGVYDKIDGDLICTTGTGSEFVEGAMCTATGFTTYYVDSATITNVKGAKRISVSMTAILTP